MLSGRHTAQADCASPSNEPASHPPTSALFHCCTVSCAATTYTMSSVKFDVKEAVASATGKEGIAHEVGNALTRGAGPGGYLAVSVEIAMRWFAY